MQCVDWCAILPEVAMMVFETWLLSIILLIAGGGGGSLQTGPLRLLRLLRPVLKVKRNTSPAFTSVKIRTDRIDWIE